MKESDTRNTGLRGALIATSLAVLVSGAMATESSATRWRGR